MTPLTSLRPRSGRSGRSGQMIVVFALCLIAIIAMAGLLVDGGRAWAERRQAQAAADTAALAGAVSLNATGAVSPPMTDADREAAAATAAKGIAVANGFGTTGAVDCSGVALPNDGITVNWPPSSASAFWNDSYYIEVFTTRAMRTAFAGVVGQPCWMVTTRATAKIPGPYANCLFCAVTEHRGDGDDNALAIDNTAYLRVDGPIVSNGPSINGTSCVPGVHYVDGLGVGHNDAVGEFHACGTAIHLYHTGGTPGDLTVLSAPSISTSGGWTSENGTVAHAENIAPNCVPSAASGLAKDPKMYTNRPLPASNFCIGVVPLKDPLAPIDPPNYLTTPLPHKGVGACPNDPDVLLPPASTGSSGKMTVTGSTLASFPGHAARICPGLYPGGFTLFGDSRPAQVTMIPGVYIMLGGGFHVGGTASIYGDGVMIYNTSANAAHAEPTVPWTGTMPVSPCPTCPAPAAALTGPNAKDIEIPATYTMTLTPASLPWPTGTVAFYNGQDVYPGCEAVALTQVGTTTKSEAKCDIIFHGFGTQWITAIYSGDAFYKETKATKSTLAQSNAMLGEQDVEICTGAGCGTALCTAWVAPDGGNCTVNLTAPHPGASYAGMLIFQDRVSEHGLQIWPGKGLAPCVGGGNPPTWMTDHTPDGNLSAPYPEPCGALGGMSGSIYAPHSRDDSLPPAGQWDATIEIHAEGVTNLQIIAGKINLIKNDNARFLFNQDLFVGGGGIKLVE